MVQLNEIGQFSDFFNAIWLECAAYRRQNKRQKKNNNEFPPAPHMHSLKN
jgi:hypothetical protein